MHFTILTLFPDIIEQMRTYGIIGRALDQHRLTLDTVNIRDFSTNKHKKVDDAPYGGGAGMLMGCEPVADAIRSSKYENSHVIFLSPQGAVLNHEKCVELSKKEHLILLCGHYEGIDERVLSREVDEEISIGDYVLSGGELGAMVLMDAVSRQVEGVVGAKENVTEDSLFDGLLKYPQYTRPEVWEGEKVPDVLMSGHHKNIEAWRREQSLRVTEKKRPDLYEKYNKNPCLDDEKMV